MTVVWQNILYCYKIGQGLISVIYKKIGVCVCVLSELKADQFQWRTGLLTMTLNPRYR